MNGQQRAVLWIGLILVGLNLVQHWASIRDVIFSGAGITSGIGSGSSSSSGGLPGLHSLIPTLPGSGGALPITMLSTNKTKTTLM
jgi:hypothetical protein